MHNKTYSDIRKSKKEKSLDGIIILASVLIAVGYFGGHMVYWMLNK